MLHTALMSTHLHPAHHHLHRRHTSRSVHHTSWHAITPFMPNNLDDTCRARRASLMNILVGERVGERCAWFQMMRDASTAACKSWLMARCHTPSQLFASAKLLCRVHHLRMIANMTPPCQQVWQAFLTSAASTLPMSSE